MSGITLYWREPLWLLLVFFPVIVGVVSQSNQRWRWQKLIDPSMLAWAKAAPASGTQLYARLLAFLAWLMFCVALAGPRTLQQVPPDIVPGESQVMIILDKSASMQARDDSLSRQAHAQRLLQQWAEEIPQGMSVGLMVFAGREHLLLNPTRDQGLLRFFVEALPDIQPPIAGNALRRAFEKATSAFLDEQGARYFLLLTDGDLGRAAQSEGNWSAKNLHNHGIRVVTVGFGGEDLVLVPGADGRPMMSAGARVVSQRNTKWLEQLSREAGGFYFDADDAAEQNLARLLKLPKPKIAVQDAGRVLWQEWFGIPLVIGLFLFFFIMRFRDAECINGKRKLVALLVIIMTLAGCEPDLQPSWEREAQAALAAESFAQAKELYAAQTGYMARFGEGVACFRLQDYFCAQAAFARAAWIAPDGRLRGRAVFNLGNTHFRLGEYAQASVLFAEAQELGVAEQKAKLNREFADALDASLVKYEKDIAKALRRAGFRAQSGDISQAQMRDQVSAVINFPGRFDPPPILESLSTEELSDLLLRGVAVIDLDTGSSGNYAKRWIKTEQKEQSGGVAKVLNPLMAMEAGLATVPETPRQIKEERPW